MKYFLFISFSSGLNHNALYESLIAVRESFRHHTCFAEEKELFDVEKASRWWSQEEHRQKVLDALENGRHSPFCKD